MFSSRCKQPQSDQPLHPLASRAGSTSSPHLAAGSVLKAHMHASTNKRFCRQQRQHTRTRPTTQQQLQTAPQLPLLQSLLPAGRPLIALTLPRSWCCCLQHAPHLLDAQQHLLLAAIVQRSCEIWVDEELLVCSTDLICCFPQLLLATLAAVQLLADCHHCGIKQSWVHWDELRFLVCCCAAGPARAPSSLGYHPWIPVQVQQQQQQQQTALPQTHTLHHCAAATHSITSTPGFNQDHTTTHCWIQQQGQALKPCVVMLGVQAAHTCMPCRQTIARRPLLLL